MNLPLPRLSPRRRRLGLMARFHFSGAWPLVVNTGTTIITLLMVFLIQNAQNEDTRELHAKLDAVLQELRAGRDMIHDPELLGLTPDEILEEARLGED